LPASRQQEMRQLFRQYLDTRLDVYEKLPDLATAGKDLQRAAKLQQDIWSHAMAGSRDDPTQNVVRLLPALNDMVDVTTSRTIALHTHLPPLIFRSVDLCRTAERVDRGLRHGQTKEPQLVPRAALRDGHFDYNLHRHRPRLSSFRSDPADGGGQCSHRTAGFHPVSGRPKSWSAELRDASARSVQWCASTEFHPCVQSGRARPDQ